MSDHSEIDADLKNYEDWVRSHLAHGKVLSSHDMHEALFSLLNYARALDRRVAALEAGKLAIA